MAFAKGVNRVGLVTGTTSGLLWGGYRWVYMADIDSWFIQPINVYTREDGSFKVFYASIPVESLGLFLAVWGGIFVVVVGWRRL